MTFLDDALGPATESVIETLGRNYTFVTATNSYDPATGANTTSQTSHTAKGTPPESYKIQQIDGDLVRSGDAKILVAGTVSFAIEAGTLVKFNSQVWTVIDVQSHYSGENVAAYELQLRK